MTTLPPTTGALNSEPDAGTPLFWEWAQSPYPGFRPRGGPLTDCSSKFVYTRLTLRGGSCVTPMPHIRANYRNFFDPYGHRQLAGNRLAEDR